MQKRNGGCMIDAREIAIEVIRASEVAFVSTINFDNFPETRALINILNKELDEKLEIYFVSDINSPKIEQLKRNSRASLYYYASEIMKNMILFGDLKIVTEKSLKDKLWQDSFLEYYKDGKDDKSYCVLKFIPTGYKYYIYESGHSQKKVEGKF
jgi:general stress protein 26